MKYLFYKIIFSNQIILFNYLFEKIKSIIIKRNFIYQIYQEMFYRLNFYHHLNEISIMKILNKNFKY